MSERSLLSRPVDAVQALLARRVPATGLAVFRILYSTVLLGEVAQVAYLRGWIFGYDFPGGGPDVRVEWVLGLWALAALCLIVGLATRFAAVVSFTLGLFTFATFSVFESHYDYVMTGANLLLLFLPVSRVLSLDRRLASRGLDPAAWGGEQPKDGRVPVLAYYLPLALGPGLVYLDSVFHKLGSPMWLRGLGFWLPASAPHVAWHDLGPLLDLRLPALAAGYLAIVFEAVFLFVFPRRRWRLPVLVVGASLHLGILLAFPIPLFACGVLSFYALLVPFSAWRRLGLGRDAAGVVAGTVPRGRARALAAGLALLATFQLASSYRAPFFARQRAGLHAIGIGPTVDRVALALGSVSRPLAGITPHTVFLDEHFRGRDRLYGLAVPGSGPERELFLVDARGMPAWPGWGRLWVRWFRITEPGLPDTLRRRGLCEATAFWAAGRGLSLGAAELDVVVKDVEVATGWERGFLRRQLARPWRNVGRVVWEDGRCRVELAETP